MNDSHFELPRKLIAGHEQNGYEDHCLRLKLKMEYIRDKIGEFMCMYLHKCKAIL